MLVLVVVLHSGFHETFLKKLEGVFIGGSFFIFYFYIMNLQLQQHNKVHNKDDTFVFDDILNDLDAIPSLYALIENEAYDFNVNEDNARDGIYEDTSNDKSSDNGSKTPERMPNLPNNIPSTGE